MELLLFPPAASLCVRDRPDNRSTDDQHWKNGHSTSPICRFAAANLWRFLTEPPSCEAAADSCCRCQALPAARQVAGPSSCRVGASKIVAPARSPESRVRRQHPPVDSIHCPAPVSTRPSASQGRRFFVGVWQRACHLSIQRSVVWESLRSA